MKKILLSMIALSFVLGVNAQKYGFINSSQLLVSLPEVKDADAQLSSYQGELVAIGENMVKEFEVAYGAYMQEAEGGTLSQVVMQQKEGDLRNKQQSIQAYELEVSQKLEQRREELYKPILEKLKNTLDQIGLENGYTMIFDSSAGAILHANETDDVMPLLRQKLGL